jgi:O-antigen/teichoic acid export membrane protein
MAVARHLLNLGWWMTVSNVISPLMVTLDRFLIGAMVSVTAVAYYTTPYEVVTKLWIISGAYIGVLFPAFATSFVQDRSRTAKLFNLGLKYIFITMFPVTLAVVVFARDGLSLWLNADFASNSMRVAQWLAVAVFINSFAQVPYALLQGAGRPDIAAKLHLIQLPFYLAGVWWMIEHYGIVGAAVTWFVRVVIDTGLLFVAGYRILPEASRNNKIRFMSVFTGLCSLLFAALIPGLAVRTIFFVVVMAAYIPVVWHKAMTPEDRAFITGAFRR